MAPIVFLHIPKTAGGSLRAAWQAAALNAGRRFGLIGETSDDLLRECDYIFGHCYYGALEAIGLAPSYVTFVRHPVSRVISHFYYLRYHRENEDGSKIKDLIRSYSNINDFFRFERHWEFENLICRLLSGDTQNAIDYDQSYSRARRHLQHFAFVGFQEHFELSCRELSQAIDLPIDPHERINVGASDLFGIDAHTLDIIAERNAYDLRLYQQLVAEHLSFAPRSEVGNEVTFHPSDFVESPASHQNAINLFGGKWISSVPGFQSGSMPLFTAEDPRPKQFAEAFGGISGWEILELGSFEGGHTFQLQNLGAKVIGIEANPAIFLRGLVANNALGGHAELMLGDFQRYLSECNRTFDGIFASGVLYHMPDPIELLYQISQHTDRVFLWTHYVPESMQGSWEQSAVHQVSKRGIGCTYYRYYYPLNWSSRSFAGVDTFCSRLSLPAITRSLQTFGFDEITILEDNVSHPGGPAVTMIGAKRAR